MFRLWLRQLARQLSRRPRRQRFGPKPPRRPRVEALEVRTLPATITWANAAGGAWETASNWDLNRVPTAGDNVVIPDLGAAGPSLTVTYNSSTTVNSITSSENVSLTGGSLTVTGNVSLLAGTFSQGTASPTSASVTLQGNLEVDGTLVIQGRSTLTLSAAPGATQQITTAGTGRISFGSFGGNLVQGNASHTVSIGNGITIDGSGNVGGGFTGTWVNHGIIDADAAQFPITFDSTSGNVYTNASDGVWEAVGGTLNLAGAWTNQGQIATNANGGSYGIVNLGGSFTTAGLNTAGFSRAAGANAGTVNITGTLNNVSANLAFSSTMGTWNLAGGTVSGGTITSSGGNSLYLGDFANLAGPIILSGTFAQGTSSGTAARVTLTGNLEVDGTLVIQGRSSLTLSAAAGVTQQITTAGSGAINFGPFGGNLVQGNASHTVSIGHGITIDGSGGLGGSPTGAWVNHGVIDSDAGQFAISFDGTSGNSYTNAPDGVWETINGTLNLAGAWTNQGQIIVNANGGAYGVLNLGGTFALSDVGIGSATTFNRATGTNAGTVNVTGTLNNTNTTLALTTVTGTWNLAGGTVSGGTITSSGGNSLYLGDFANLAGPIILSGTFAQGTSSGTASRVTLTGNLEVDGTLVIQGRSSLTLSAAAGVTQQITTAGSGAINFGPFGGNLVQGNASHTVSIGHGLFIDGSGTFGDNGVKGAWVNHAVIDADAGQFAISFDNTSGNSYVNASDGVWETINGTLNLAGAWTNQGQIIINANGGAYGVLNLGGTFALSDVGIGSATTFNRATGTNAGTVNVTGTLNNTGTNLVPNSITGSWVLAGGGTINGGTITNSASFNVTPADLSNLAGPIVVNGTFTMGTSSGSAVRVTLTGDMELDGTLIVQGRSSLTLSAAAGVTQQITTAGSGAINFGPFGGNLIQGNASHTVSIGHGLFIDGSGTFGDNGVKGAWVNHAVIDADAGQFAISFDGTSGNSYTNAVDGVWETIGGTLNLAGAWTNQGQIVVNANGGAYGIVNLGGTFPGSGRGTWSRSGGTVNLTGTVTGGLTLDDTTGTWNLVAGTLQGGTFQVAPGSSAKLVINTNQNNNLTQGVKLLSPIDMATAGTSVLVVSGGLTLDTTLNVGNASGSTYGLLIFSGSQTLSTDGGGTIVMGGTNLNTVYPNSGSTLTIGPGILIHGQSGSIGSNSNASNSTVINQATIVADIPSTTNLSANSLSISPTTFQNVGTLRATAGARLQVEPTATLTNLTNTTTVTTTNGTGNTKTVVDATLSGGTWEADANSSLWIYPVLSTTTIQIVRNAATVILNGSGANFNNTQSPTTNPVFDNPLASLTTNLGSGSLTVTNGANFTTPAGFVNQGTLTVGSNTSFATDPSLLPDEGLILWWRADGNATDSSGTGLTGILHNGVTYGAGEFGQAWSFPAAGTAYVMDDGITPPNVTGTGLTVEAWVNPAAGNSGTRYLFDKYTGGTGGYSLALVNGVPTLYLGTTGNANFTLTAPSALPQNAFSYVAATYDGSTATLYVNGTAVASAALTGNIVSDGNVPRVGNDDNGSTPTAGFIGLLDNIAVYGRARSAAEIAATFNPGGFTQTSGQTSVNGLLTTGPGVTISGGTLGGSGSIGTVSVPTNVTNSGTVSPGNSPGQLNIIGNYVQTAAGTLKLEIGGRTAGTTYDQLRVTGTASFNGTVQVKLVNGFVPAGGDSFQMVSYTPPAGQFSTQQIDSPGPGRRFNVLYDDQGKFFTLQVQGVPPLDFGYATPQATGSSVARKVATDGSGNAYVVGYFSGTTDFDPFHSYGDNHDVLTTNAIAAGYLAKYDVTGALVWVRAFDPGAGLASHANDVALDGSGNVWVTGDFQGTSVYGGGSLTSAGGSDAFLLKTDGSGTALSLQQVGGTGNDAGQGITVNTATGDVLVTGSFSGSADFDPGAGTFTLNSAGGGDAFVLRLNGAGVFQGAARLGGGGGDTGSDVAVDAVGNVWLTGDFSQVTTGLAALTSAGGATDTRSDIFLLKLAPAGTGFTTVVAQQFGALGDDHGTALAVDASGSVLLTGSFHFSVNFDRRPGKSFTLTSSGDSDIFVLKEDNSGTFVWARVIGGYKADAANDVTTDAAGNVYLTGSFQDRVDFDPLDGSYILEAQPGDNAFLSKLDATGSFVWAAQLTDPATTGPAGVSDGYGIAEDAAGRVFTVGSFLNTIDFDPGLGVQSRSTPAGQTQGFVSMVKQKAAPTGTILGLPSAAVPEGTTLALGSAVSDADSVAFTYSWTVARNGVNFATSTGPDLSALLTQPGAYTVTLAVSDESGNTNTQTATVQVNNAAPVLAAAVFGTAAQTANPGPATNDQFGKAMASGNGYLLVGAPLDDSAATDAGAAYLYNATTGALLLTLTDPAASAGDLFGSAVAVVGNNLLIGAPGAAGGGKAYLFSATGSLLNTFTGPNRAAGDSFGGSVGGLGNLLLIGASGKTTAVGSGVGEAYLYDAVAGSYRLLQTFANPTPEANDQFGATVAAVGATVVVGAPNDNQAGPAAGAAYVFDPQTGNLLTTLLNPNPTATGAQFGGALAASGTRALVGAPTDAVAGAGVGGVYLFDANPSSATFGALLKAVHVGSGGFGRALAVSGNRALVGADTDNTTVANSGTAYLIDIDPGSSTYGTSLATFKKASPAGGDRFGGAVAFGGNDAVVGAPLDDTGATDSGATYRFAATAFVKASASSINENDTVTLSGAFSDAGSEAHLVRLDWLDGSTPTVLSLGAGTYTFSATHQYLDNPVTGVPSGAFTVSIKVMDQTPDLLVLDNGVNGIGPTRAATTVLRYDGSTGAYESTLVSGAGLTNVTGLAVGPDGNVYLANDQGPGNATAVVRYDGQSGAALGTFVTTAAGITGDPTGVVNDLTFGPDGNLYVLSLNGGVAPVLRFNGLTGAALPAPGQTGATFVAAAGSGITGTPSGFTFGPDGNLYVADGSTVLRYGGSTGQPLPAPGQSGAVFVPSDGTLTSGDLAFGPDGSLYVFNRQIGQMYRYDPTSGTFTGIYSDVTGSTAAHDFFGADGHFYRADNGGHVLQSDGATGQTLGEFVPSGALLNGGLHSSGFLANLDPEQGTTFNVTVNNVAPTVVIHAAPGSTTTQINLTSTVTDPGTLDVNPLYAWSVTNGTPIGQTNTANFSFAPGTGTITVTLTVKDKDTGTTTVSTQVIVGTAGPDNLTISNPAAGTGRVVVFALAGDDRVNASGVTTVPVELVGGAGNDTLIGGTLDDVLYGNEANNYAPGVSDDHGADSLVGGSGNDTLDGGLGNDTMAGGVGNDYYIEVPGSADLLVETGDAFGVDSIDLSQATFGITLSLAQSTGQPQLVNAGQTSTVALQGQFENLSGSNFNDVLTGSTSANAISGGAGNDVIFGGDPLDTLNGGQGNSSLPGVQGNDSLVGGTGNDTIYGGWGNDVIFGDYVPSTLPGGSGISSLPGAQGNDSVPGNYNDTIIGGRGNDTIYGGAGNDVIFGGDTLSTMVGSGGSQPGTDDNSIIGGSGNDTIYGGAGNDVIFGGDSLTTLSGGAGNSTSPGNDNNSIIGGGGNDTIYGGAGNDVIFGGDTQTTMVGASSPGNDNNSIVGGGGNDTIYGGAGNDVIFGGDTLSTMVGGSSSGNDNNSIIGGGGNDTIYGGAGNDVIFGGDMLNTLVSSSSPGNDNNSIIGGGGNDTIYGGAGNDVIFGGDTQTTLSGGSGNSASSGNDNNSIIAGGGNDTVYGGAGNDVIFGGDTLDTMASGMGNDSLLATDNDSIIGGGGNDTIYGGPGNDIIFGGDTLSTLVGSSGNDTLGGQDNNSIIGGQGNDTIYGGAGNDVIFGGDTLDTLPAATGGGDDSLVGGPGNDTIYGGAGNDVIFGGDGNDVLSGGPGTNIVEGEGDYDVVVESSDANMVLTPTRITVGSNPAELFYDVEAANLTGGNSGDSLDASTFPGPVTLVGGSGNDTLLGGPAADYLSGGAGNDSLVAGAGDDTLDGGAGNDAVSGGDGNDTYFEIPGGGDVLSDSGGIDSVDFSQAPYGISLDLNATAAQVVDSAGNTVTLNGTFENVIGTSYADKITGNSAPNVIDGAGGNDTLDGGAGNDVVQGAVPQVVYLDFDSATGLGEHVYTTDERNAIQAQLEKDFAFPFSFTWSQTAPAVGEYTTLLFNAGGISEALVGGQADQIDARNEDLSGFAAINVNGLLGHAGQPPATSANFVGLSTTIAAHELGHELGLQHADAYGPLGINPVTGLPYGIYSGLVAKSVSRNEVITNPGGGTALGYLLAHSPVLTGPVQMAGDAAATPHPQPSGSVYAGTRLVASFTVNSDGTLGAVTTPIGQGPAVVGGSLNLTSGLLVLTWSADPGPNSVVMNYDYDPYRPGYRGPDDAFETPNHIMASPSSVGTTLAQATATTYFGERELVKLAFADAGVTVHQDPTAPHVPVVVGGTTYSAQSLGTLPALAVPNLLPAGTTNYGTVFNVRATSVVGTLATGGQSDFYAFTGKAGDLVNLETYSNALTGRVSDPIDSVLSVYDSSGNLVPYYGTTAVSDDTFESQDSAITDLVLPADGTYYVKVNAFSPADTGSYELLLYTFAATPIAQHGGDTLIGGPGSDVLIGSTGDDVFVGSLGEDIFLGYTPADSTTITLNHAPVASNGTATVAHRSGAGVDIPLAATDADNDPLTYGIVSGPLHGTLTLNGATAHFVPAGNFVGTDTFTWKANDGTLDSNIATVTITVTNSAPTVGVALSSAAPLTNDTLTATATPLDADGDPVTLTFVWKVNGSTVKTTTGTTATSDALDLSAAANGNRGDTITVEVTPNDGFTSGTTASSSAVVADTAPTANPQSATLFEDTAATINLSGSDPDSDALTFIIVNGPSHGTLTGSGAALTYTPAANYNGPDGFTYKANDGLLDSAPVAVAITVNPVNDAPVFTKGSDQSVLEDAGPQTVTNWATGISAGPADESGQMLTFLVSTDNASLFAVPPSIDPATGTLTYTSAVDANGTATVTVRLMDNGGTANGGVDTSAAQTFVITVVAVNDPPIANDDYVTTDEDTPVTIPVLANDRPGPLTAVDEYSQTLTVTRLNGVAVAAGSAVRTAHGSVLLNADGTVTYTPDPDYNGQDGFAYTIQDNGVPPQSATATGYVTINPVNDAPVLNSTSAAFPAVNEDDTANAGTPVSTFAASLDVSDVDAGAVRGLAVTGVDEAHGDWQFSTDGGATWTSFGAASPSAARLLAATPSDRIRFVPDLYFRGQATFTFRAWDTTAGADGGTADTTVNGGITAFSTAVGTATVTINPVNHAPVAAADSYATDEDTLLAPAPSAGVLANDTDVDGDMLQAVLVSGPQHAAAGGFTLFPDGSFRYFPAANYNGPDSFTYQAFDGQAYSNTVTVALTINPVDDAPVAPDGMLSTNEDTAASGSLVASDVDTPASGLTYAVVTGPAHGTLVLDKATGQYTYTPAANYNGPDAFSWKANDGTLDSNTATVSISVAPVNDPPVAYAQSVTTDEDTALSVQLTGDDGDPEVVQVLTFAIASGPSHGTLTGFDPATGRVTYTPAADYNGPDAFTFRVTDDASAGAPAGLSATATVTITVNSVNDPPAAQDDVGATYEDTTLTGASVLANDSDYHNGAPGENNVPLTAVLVSGPAHAASFALNADGTYSYTPSLYYHGSDSFTYQARDSLGALSNPATVSLTIYAVNHPPVANPDSATTDEDHATSGNVLSNDTDVDGDPLSVVAVNGQPAAVGQAVALASGARLTVNADGSYTYDPRGAFDALAAGATATDGFTYVVADGQGGLATGSVTVTVTGVDDAPVAQDTTSSVGHRSAAGVDIPLAASDVDTAALTYQIVTAPAHGTVTLSGNVAHYVPAGDYVGTDTFTWKANDGTLDSNTAPVTITLTNSAPTVGVALSSSAPLTNDTLTATATPLDADGDPVALTFVWKVNGNIVRTTSTAATSDALDLSAAGNGNRGDTITVEVTPNDGFASGATATAAASVADSAPVIDSVSIDQSGPRTGDTLSVTVHSHDDDGDGVTYSYQWYKDDIAISGATGSTLDLSVAGNGDRGDGITVAVTPSDGSLSGPAVTSATVAVQDTAPVVMAVTITPSAPSVSDTLTATVSSSDADGDAVSYAYQWYRNGAAIAGATASTLTVSGSAAHGDSITVAVTPSDGTLSGAAVTSPAVTVQDTAPVVDSVTITPASPTITSVLTANVSSHDADGDTVSFSYQWFRNGVAIAGATASTLTVSGNAVHGDAITVAVTPSDGSLSGPVVTSATVAVQDTAPVVTSVTITPSAPSVSDTLTANVSSSDADSDAVSYSYQWYKNNAAITGATGNTLSVSGSAVHGDSLTVKVTPSDGTLSGAAVTGAAVTVQDTAPVITAVSIAPANPTTNQVLAAAVTAHDADGDAIAFAYQWYKNGAALSGATASSLDLSRAGNGDRGDSITVTVTPSDGTLGGTAVTSAAVTVADSAPVIDSVSITPTNPTATSALTANVTSHDADGDAVTYGYQWYKNNAAISGATGSTLNLAQSGNAAAGDAITVAVKPSDGALGGATVTSAAVTVTSSGATATTTALTSSVASAIPGQSISFTATVAPTQGTGTPTGSVDFLDTTTGTDLGSVTLSAGQAVLSTSALALGSHTIQASYGGDAHFLPSSATLTQVVTRSVYVLSSGAAAAVSLSGNANVTIPGSLVIDSGSATALSESGSAHLTAGAIQVVGGVQKSGSATVSPAPVTGAAAAADPLGSLAVPSVSGSATSVSVGGSTVLTINPGVYSQISASGNAKLTLKPGVYVLAGGGLSVTGSASVSGSGVLIYNAGSQYTAGGGTGGTFGAISVSGSAQLNLSAATSGAYAGIALFQSRDDIQTISLSGSAAVGLSSGVLYAPAAVLSISGNAQLPRAPLVVSQLQVSGNGASINAHVGGGTGPNADADTSNGLAFTAAPQALAGGTASRAITVQLVDADGNAVTAGSGGVTLALSTTSAYGSFLDTNGNPLVTSAVTIPEGSSSVSFEYADSTVGFPVLTASAPGLSATQQETVSPGSAVYSPAALRTAYGVNNVAWDGTGQTIAIVDAYDDPSIFQSLDAFDSLFGRGTSGPTLYQEYGPASSFLTVLNQDGGTALPAADPVGAGAVNWEVEEALDLEWAHALAPGAQIVLVEANSQSLPDLMTAVATAAAQPGVSVVSMSWGFVEGQDVLAQDEATYDSYLTTPAGHTGVTFVASTGDYGAGVPQYPAFSPNVVAVGGTALTVAGGGAYGGEVAWGYYDNELGAFVGGGGGLSQYEAEPAFQQGVQSTGYRTTPDVAFVADPATGAWVADSYNLSAADPWEIAGGTSLSAPAWAGLLALADQGRAEAKLAALGSGGPAEAQAALYGLSAADYHDVTSGSNGYAAGAGYDLATGLGTPVADQLVTDLAAYSGSASATPVAPIAPSGLVLSDNVGTVGGTVAALARAAALRVFSVEGVTSRVAAASGRPHGAEATGTPAAARAPAADRAGEAPAVSVDAGASWQGTVIRASVNSAGADLATAARVEPAAGRGNGSSAGTSGGLGWSPTRLDVPSAPGGPAARIVSPASVEDYFVLAGGGGSDEDGDALAEPSSPGADGDDGQAASP